MIEEGLSFFRDEIEFYLFRHLFVRPIADYVSLEARQGTQSSPMDKLPSWESLTPIDLQNRWILEVKAHVLQDNKPDEIRKLQDQLMAIRSELDGVFEFRSIDRKVHDTRVAREQQGVQALAQRVTLTQS